MKNLPDGYETLSFNGKTNIEKINIVYTNKW